MLDNKLLLMSIATAIDTNSIESMTLACFILAALAVLEWVAYGLVIRSYAERGLILLNLKAMKKFCVR